MASAMDSGVDTGNDSNDSLAQEKHSLLDLSYIKPKQRTLDSEKENSSEEEQDNSHTSSKTMVTIKLICFIPLHIRPSRLSLVFFKKRSVLFQFLN